MDADSEPETEGVGDEFANDKHFILCTRVRDMREEIGRRIQRMSAKSAHTIADQLRLAYYQNTLRFYEPLPPETRVHSGYTFALVEHSSRHPKEVREINRILDYLIPESEIKTNLLWALPGSARLSSRRVVPVVPLLNGRRRCGHYSCRSILVTSGPRLLSRFAAAERRGTMSAARKTSAKVLTASNGFSYSLASNFLRKPSIRGVENHFDLLPRK